MFRGAFSFRSGLRIGAVAVAAAIMALPNVSVAEERGVTTNSIKLGTLMPLTGLMAIYGSPMRAGNVAYVGLVNERGGINGRKIDLLVEDNQFSTEQTVAIARRMVSRDGIFAFLNPNGVVQMAATFPYVLEQKKVPIFGNYGGLVEWYSPPRAGLFGLMVPYEPQAEAMGYWVAEDKRKKVVVVHFATSTFDAVAKHVEPAYRRGGGEGSVEIMPIKLGTQDYAPIALEIAAKKPDGIITLQTQQEMVALSRALANQGMKVPLYMWAPNVAQSTLDLGAQYLEGAVGVSWTIVSPLADTPAVKEFRYAMQKYVPDQKPDFTALFNFAQAKVFFAALSRIKGTPTHEALYQELYSLKNYDTDILPPVTFAPDRHLGITQLQRMKIQNGAWVPVGAAIDPSVKWW